MFNRIILFTPVVVPVDETVNDAITISDSIIGEGGEIYFEPRLKDTLTVADTIDSPIIKTLQEYIAITQSLAGIQKGTKTVSESLFVFDDAKAAKQFLENITETIALADTITAVTGLTLLEYLAVAETIACNSSYNLTVNEALRAGDTALNVRAFSETLTETLPLTDTLALLMRRLATANETLGVADTVTPQRTGLPVLNDSLTITETVSAQARYNQILTEVLTLRIGITLNGEAYQCWAFSPDDMYASLYTNYAFNSYASLDGHDYGMNAAGINILEGTDDAGTEIQRGVRVNYASMGTHLKKRLFHAFFGLVGEEPVLKVITDSGEAEYYVVGQKAHIAKGLNGVNWELILTQIDSLDFIEITPVILSR